MTNFTNQFLKRMKGIRLSDNERLRLRERLALYADMHPALEAPVASVYGGFFSIFSSRRLPAFAGALALLVMVGSGISFAAEESAPGDSLYALKIHVNEPLMTAFAPTATGQAKVAASIATRRVDEAVKLASRGTLTPERQAYLSNEFNVRVKVAAKKADDLASTGDATGAAIAKADFAAHLAGEAQALGAVSRKDSAQTAELLRTVVETSEEIAGGGSASIAVATASEEVEEAEVATTMAAPADTARVAAKAALMSAPTTTPPTKNVSGRFGKRFDGHATTTVRIRITPAALSPTDPILPKIDVAIPKLTLPAKPSEGIDIQK